MIIKFSHARTALKYGLLSLKIKPKDEILIPEYICDAVILPLKDLKIKYSFYPLNKNLSPKWDDIQSIINKTTKAIMMVHYFGQPQNIQNFLDFSKKNNLLLIEDNAHGYGGKYQGVNLGNFGDIAISSPRKLINIYSGGILQTSKEFNINIERLNLYPVSNFNFYIKKIFNQMPFLKNQIKKIANIKRPKYENPLFEVAIKIKDYKMDKISEKIFNHTDWNKVKSIRQKNYLLWLDFALKNNLTPVFKNFNTDSVPWCCPVYVRNFDESLEWFKWGWEKNIRVFSWPTLPSEILNIDDHPAFLCWKKIICFSTDSYL